MLQPGFGAGLHSKASEDASLPSAGSEEASCAVVSHILVVKGARLGR